MTVRRVKPESLRTINIDGPQGNAFVLMGHAQAYCKQLGIDAKPVIDEMTSSDYIHLLKVFDRYFGGFITLETENEEYLAAFDKD